MKVFMKRQKNSWSGTVSLDNQVEVQDDGRRIIRVSAGDNGVDVYAFDEFSEAHVATAVAAIAANVRGGDEWRERISAAAAALNGRGGASAADVGGGPLVGQLPDLTKFLHFSLDNWREV